MLKWLVWKKSFLIQSINTASFETLLNHLKKNKIEVFALFIMNINKEIMYNTQCNLNVLNVSLINKTTQNLKDIKAKLSSKYHEFLDVFVWVQLNKLLSHHFYDHKIELINDSTLFCYQVYQMSSVKFLKVKKYLNENLSKKFITSSQILYFFLILFILKANEDLQFCVCYEHVWINQSSDLTLINLIKASHDAMSSLNLAHLFKSFSTLLLVVQHFLHSSLSLFF